jgi:hypothetical protein
LLLYRGVADGGVSAARHEPHEMPMIHRKEFFELQWQFATGAAALADKPLGDALLAYTNFYARFGLGRDFDAAHPVWRDYLDGLHRSSTPLDWTYAFYRSRLPDRGAPGTVARVGCFSYARLGNGRIRLHFHNAEPPGVSPLAADRQAQRREELRRLLAGERRHEGAATRVIGASWLYNLEAYRRLFPPAYLCSATVGEPRFRHMPLWGQFLDRHGAIRREAATALMQRLSMQRSIDGLAACFPLQVLALDGVVSMFLQGAWTSATTQHAADIAPLVCIHSCRRGSAAA